MGLWDTVFCEVICCKCRQKASMQAETKSLTCSMSKYRIGDSVDTDGQGDGEFYASDVCSLCQTELFVGFVVENARIVKSTDVLTLEQACKRTGLPTHMKPNVPKEMLEEAIRRSPELREQIIKGNPMPPSKICSELGTIKRLDERDRG